MPGPDAVPVYDLEQANRAHDRVTKDIDAVSEDNLAAYNVEMLAATSIAIGALPNIASWFDRIVAMPGMERRWAERVSDYAYAAWYLYVTNLPLPETPSQLEAEVPVLRNKLLMWAVPLAQAGIFNQAAIDKIREGSGIRESAADLVALVALYQHDWDKVRNMCGVTQEDLDRASRIGPAVFGAVSRRELETAKPTDASTLRVRKAWTLLDRAYTQCRRAVSYYRYVEGDVDTILPNLRRVTVTRRPADPQTPAVPETPAPAVGPAPILVGPPVGGGGSPFINR